MTFDLSILPILGLIIFGIGYVIGVIREKYKWWKLFQVVEPEDFFTEPNPWHNKMNEEALKEYYKLAICTLKARMIKDVLVLILCIGIIVWIIVSSI